MAKNSRYIIAFAASDGNVLCTSVLMDIYSAEAIREIRSIFAERMMADYALIWRYDGTPITKTEQTKVAKCMREAVTPGWTLKSDTSVIRGGKFGRKYVDSELCMVVQWNGLLLPYKYSHWSDFMYQCRIDAQQMIQSNMIGLENMKDLSSYDAQTQREADPGYLTQVEDHVTRNGTATESQLPYFDDKVMRQCTKLIQKGNSRDIFVILADACDIPLPKISTDIGKHPLAYAFYDTTQRTIVYAPETVVSMEQAILGVMAGFFRYMAQYYGWRFYDDPTSSLNYELDISSDFATSITDALLSSIKG